MLLKVYLYFFRIIRKFALVTFRFVGDKLNIGIVSRNELSRLQKIDFQTSTSGLQLLAFLPKTDRHKYINLLNQSKAQLLQDLFVLSTFNYKSNGYFVEFGATDGVTLSNTFLLESNFNWKGILAEPAKIWHKELKNNRPNSTIETLCVWSRSNQILQFRESRAPELSSIKSISKNDLHKNSRKDSIEYQVETISLLELLSKHNAPEFIDYLSIDTEGSEFEILKSFDFSKYRFGVITCEHNYTFQEEKIHKLLLENGYKRVHSDISKWDSWFVWSGEGWEL